MAPRWSQGLTAWLANLGKADASKSVLTAPMSDCLTGVVILAATPAIRAALLSPCLARLHSLALPLSGSLSGPVFQCKFDRRSNWSPINFGSWSEIISMTVFQSPINDWSSIKSPIKLIADYWPINEIIDDQTWPICSSLKNIASLRRPERSSSRIKMKFQW